MPPRIAIPSYHRPNGHTFELMKNYTGEWYVYVYRHDENLQEYIDKYGKHVHIIETTKRNLAFKRQYILDLAKKDNVMYLITIDDDVQTITDYDGNTLSIEEMVNNWTKIADDLLLKDSNTAQICSSWYNKNPKHLYANNAFGSHSLWIVPNCLQAAYNQNSKCEDIEFSADLISHILGVYRTSDIVIVSDYAFKNAEPNGGLDYRLGNDRTEEETYIEDLLKKDKYQKVRRDRLC